MLKTAIGFVLGAAVIIAFGYGVLSLVERSVVSAGIDALR